jgi:predicted small secreted protein
MDFDHLIDFIDNRMRMSHIYQPLMLRILVEAGGTATIRQLAHGFLAQDESQLRYYESRIRQMPLPVLKKRGVISHDGELVTLNCGKLTFEQKAQVLMSCEKRLQHFIIERGLDCGATAYWILTQYLAHSDTVCSKNPVVGARSAAQPKKNVHWMWITLSHVPRVGRPNTTIFKCCVPCAIKKKATVTIPTFDLISHT